MSHNSMYQLRIDEKEKQETFAVLAEMGIKPAKAVRMFFHISAARTPCLSKLNISRMNAPQKSY